MTTYDLTGKVALVTGGSRGIGRAIVGRLHQAGARVAIVARDGTRASAFAAELGERAMAVGADVAQPAQVTKAVESVEAAFGPLDILVNNAGVTRDGLLVRMSEADWGTVLDTNLKGVWLCLKHEIPQMLAQGGGAIVNMSSLGGLAAIRGMGAYAASKHGVVGLTRAAAVDQASSAGASGPLMSLRFSSAINVRSNPISSLR